MHETRSLQASMRLLYLGGQSPLVYDLFSKISTWFCLLCVIVVCPLVLVKMFQELEDVDVLVPTFESMMSLYQLTIKVLTMNRNRKSIANLLEKMDARFWYVQDYQREVHETMEIGKTVKVSWWFVLTYCVGGFFLCFGFVIKPIFNPGRQVPLLCWTPDGNPTPFYVVIYAMQAYILFAVCVNVAGFDAFYMSLNVRICVQFKLLRYELENLVANGKDENEIVLKLKKCIEHHQFLLDCSNEVMEFWSLLLLNQYVAFIITICVELYNLTETDDPAKAINCIMYLFEIGVEAVLICAPPTLLEDESSKIATAAYLSNWYEIKSKGTCESVIVLMRRSQSSVVFNAGGLFAINVACLIDILKTGISVYTLMKNRKHGA